MSTETKVDCARTGQVCAICGHLEDGHGEPHKPALIPCPGPPSCVNPKCPKGGDADAQGDDSRNPGCVPRPDVVTPGPPERGVRRGANAGPHTEQQDSTRSSPDSTPEGPGSRTLLAALRHASWHAMERFKDHGRPVDKWDADLLERHADSLARFPDDGDGGEEWFEALIEQVSSAKCALNEVLGGHNGDGDRGAWVDAANNLNDALSGIADLRQRLRGAERKLDTDLQMFRAMGEQRDAAEERERRLRAIASYSGHTQFCVASVGLPCDCGYDAALAALELEREAEDPR